MGESVPKFAGFDVVAYVGDAGMAELRVAQSRECIMFIKTLLGLARRFDVPGDQRRADRSGDFLGEQSLAGAWLALDQQGPLENDRRVDRNLQIVRGDISRCAFKAHG